MKKVLVTGSNGFLASRFNEYYKDKYDILALSHKELDITNENQVYDFFKNNNIDIVFILQPYQILADAKERLNYLKI